MVIVAVWLSMAVRTNCVTCGSIMRKTIESALSDRIAGAEMKKACA
jgi:hypothetical protein